MAKFFLFPSDQPFAFGLTKSTTPRSNTANSHSVRDLASAVGYLCAFLGVLAATVILWVLRPYLDAGNESLLYLPIVIACALRFGFGPAVFASLISFACWDYFFDVPYYALTISNAHDCISLVIYLIVAVTTAHLAARAKIRRRESEARERETSLLYRASSALSCEVDTDRSLLTLAEQIIYLCSASPCMIFLANPMADSLKIAVSLSASLLSEGVESSILHTAYSALHTDGVVRIDVNGIASGENADVADYAVHPECGLYVPLTVHSNRVGVLHIGPSFDGTPLSAQDERIILTLANHAAVVIARQLMAEESKEQARRTAVLDERNRLARDVHDTLSHAFTGIKFLLEAANRIDSPEQTKNCIIQARNLAIEGAQEARRSVLALRPAALEEAGNLVDALKKLVEDRTTEVGPNIEVLFQGELSEISPKIEENVLRICQEAITNAIKHAYASGITVDAIFSPLLLKVLIADNGRGFSHNSVSTGFGLTSMRERAVLLGGDLTVTSSPGEGTRLVVTVPLIDESRK